MLNIVLMGPPGAGKGTHALWIAKDYGLPHISTGDMFREAMASGSELGNKIKAIVNSGGLVSDDLTCALVKERLSRKDCENGYLLDGFPRTIAQAEALKTFGKEINREVNTVMNISCPDELLIERIAGRRVCPRCGASYNVTFMPPKKKEGICRFEKPIKKPASIAKYIGFRKNFQLNFPFCFESQAGLTTYKRRAAGNLKKK